VSGLERMHTNHLVFTRESAGGLDALVVIAVETLDSADTAGLLVRLENAIASWVSDPATGGVSLARHCAEPTIAEVIAANAFRRESFQACLRNQDIRMARVLYSGPVAATYEYERCLATAGAARLAA